MSDVSRSLLVVSATVALGSVLGCGSAERTTVDQFFRAARADDGATLAAMSAVGAPVPVESWEVVETTSRETLPYELRELRSQMREAEKNRDAQLEEGRQYLVDHREALDEIIPKLQEDSSYRFQGAMAEIQDAWLRLVDDRRAKERAFQDLKRAVDHERELASKSVMSQTDVEQLDGTVEVADVLTRVRSPEGDEGLYTVTLRKYELHGAESDRTEPSRWVVVAIEEASPA